MQTTVKIPGQNKPRLNTQISNGSGPDSLKGDAYSNGASGNRLSPSSENVMSHSSLMPGQLTKTPTW